MLITGDPPFPAMSLVAIIGDRDFGLRMRLARGKVAAF
jgi:hypothetical protein